MSTPPLPPAQVPASVYDEAYYLAACAGYEEWARSDGREAAGIYAGVLSRTRLAEARRLLRPGGRVIAHTMPNRTVYRWTYRARRLLHRSWPKDPRNEWEHRMHVNERSVASLRRVMWRVGFANLDLRTGAMVYAGFVPTEGARSLYYRLAARRATRRLCAFDVWAAGVRP